jgi:hypothetical protein
VGKLCISVHFTARCTPCIAFMLVAHTCTFVIFMLVAHTCTFVIDHVELGRMEPSEPALVEIADYEQGQDKPQCI